MLRDSSSYEVQVVEAVRSVNRALGGKYGTSSAIYKSEYNQYEVQLIDAIKGIARTLSGTGLVAGAGGEEANLAGYATKEEVMSLSRRVSILESESFFRMVDGNITLKEGYTNLWVPGWLSAGGVGSGGGGGGTVDHLYDIGDVQLTDLTDGQGIVWDAALGKWKNATVGGGGGGTGTVTAVKLGTVPYNPDTNGVVTLPAYPTTLPASDVYAWAKASTKPSYSFSELTGKPTTLFGYGITDAKIQNGTIYLGGNSITPLTSFTETDPTVPAWAKETTPNLYTLGTKVKTSAARGKLLGVSGISYGLTSSGSEKSLITWDTDLEAWHLKGNLYADGWVAAGGIGSGGGGGGGSTVNWGTQGADYVQLNVEGVTKNLLTAHQSLTGYVTIATTQTITGAKTFSSDLTMSGANIVPQTDSSGSVGTLNKRFSNGYIRDIYTSYLQFIDGTTKAVRGNIAIGDDYAQITLAGTPEVNYIFYRGSGFFKIGGGVPCGSSEHRWSCVYTVGLDITSFIALGGARLYGFDGYFRLRTGADIDTSYKDIVFHEDYGFYPDQAGVNLGYNGASYRWATIYGVNGNLTGNLTLTSTSVITLGPVTISYDSVSRALHISGTDSGQTIGLYCDGFVSAGGVAST